ncbi:MAG: hypothetical protein GY760_14170 [Deltaproteobacteria bacterium]|nr:hypothetical protein [Deltaproteobacteria bacterium]
MKSSLVLTMTLKHKKTFILLVFISLLTTSFNSDWTLSSLKNRCFNIVLNVVPINGASQECKNRV